MPNSPLLFYRLLLTRDLKLHQELAQRAIELKRTLTGLIQKLKADR